jgi:flagella basal body P-ring formation protein FlgA
VKLFRFALIANDDIERNTELTQQQFRVEIIDATEFRSEPLPVGEIANLRSRLFIRKGSALLKEMVEEKPIINPGDVVWLNSAMGNVNVRISVISRQEGKVDEIIRVVSDGKKIFRAKVLDKNNVLVME